MASLNQITTSIAKKKQRENDFEYKMMIAHMVRNYVAFFIRQSLAKGDILDKELLDFNMKLIRIPVSQCPEFGCDVLRTESKVPKPIRTKLNDVFRYVGNVEFKKSYNFIQPEQVEFMKSSKFGAKEIRYAYFNDYLWLFNNTVLKWVRIQGYFEDPIEVGKFQCNNNNPCVDWDSEYPVSQDILVLVEAEILNQLRLQEPGSNEEIKINEIPPRNQ